MDFYQIVEKKYPRKGLVEIYPDFLVQRSKDLMIRGGSFYGIWDTEKEMWSTDEFDVARLIDNDLRKYRDEKAVKNEDFSFDIKYMSTFSSLSWTNFKKYINQMADNSHQLDEDLTFLNTVTKKTNYVSRRLPYSLEEGSINAYDELMSTLYNPKEREKLEWAMGSIIAGDAKHIQKFIVLYGEAGSGKSTFLNIVQKLFDGYCTTFDAKALTSSSNAFSTEVFKNNPLVAIQHDGDLSKIEDNTKLNSIVSHEDMPMNEKYKSAYTSKTNCFLFMGTNKAVKITDAKSGIIRRLIDVQPSNHKVATKRYHTLIAQIDFELGAIAWHCLQVYRALGKNYYTGYRPMNMILQTDVFFNFVESNYYVFQEQDNTTLSQAYDMYKIYCDESLVEFKLPRHKFREELKSYFGKFEERGRLNGQQIRNYYYEFLTEKFESIITKDDKPYSLVLEDEESILDQMLFEYPAQYATSGETPEKKWEEVKTKLSDINTKKLHYVQVPINHIVIDFDLKDDSGNKSMELNIEAASKWPSTYAEFSKGGSGIHLHYIYDGDATKLSRIYEENIEIKVFFGKSSLRRKLTKCNNVSVATIKSGLPLKGDKMVNFDSVKNEAAIRTLIKKNLNKEIHSGTKPSIDFIYKILEDVYKDGVKYDVSDLRPKVLTFANNSTHQSDYCIKLVSKMHFASSEVSTPTQNYMNNIPVFFDVEVFPNLFVVVWKQKGPDKPLIKMINPSSQDMEVLMKMMLVGFNCRDYDNHIVYARYIGYDLEQLYNLSQKIIGGNNNCKFGEAYNISYTDIYDFASAGNKQSLKKWEIELGIHHNELGLPWDQPVPEELWSKVADYCGDDVLASEATFDHLAGDYMARLILSELSGLTPNDKTNNHTARIVFGTLKNTKGILEYTDLSTLFPEYQYKIGISTYRGEQVGEGGYVYSEPGMYKNVALLDVASMHPTSIEELNLFGPYTKNYSDMKKARIAIKHKDRESLGTLMAGKLLPFFDRAINGEFSLKDLSNALKTALNSAYGLTSARFDNLFRDSRNVDNIVAKRGALFMIDLKHAVQAKGFTVAHIKTDSIKIPDATQEIIDFVFEFGRKYGYDFEHEETYEKLCLVNDAVYIAKTSKGEWSATGAQFAQPYVFKTLFSNEEIEFKDLCETKSVTSALYLDMNEGLGFEEHNYQFIGKVGSFCPIKPGHGGGLLLRKKEDKYDSATGCKGYRWIEAEIVATLGIEDSIDLSYYNNLVDGALDSISKYGDAEWFISDDVMFDEIDTPIGFDDPPPHDCKNNGDCQNCLSCMNKK